MTKVNLDGNEIDLEHAMSSIGEGWKPMVRQLVDDLYRAGWNGRTAQIKEKFGGLRFYASGVPKEAQELIIEAEMLSMKTCERCGNPGKPRSERGWILTLCDKCDKCDE